MKTSRTYFSILFLIIVSYIVLGCYKKEFSNLKLANAQPEYLYPLLDAQLNLKDIVDPNKKKLNIIVDSNGYYTFIYYNNFFQQYVTDLLQIGDLSISESEGLTAPEITALPVSGSVTRNFANSFTIASPNGEKLKTLTLQSGSIPFNISSTFKHNIQLTLTFPYITKNAVPLSTVISINYGGTVPVISNNNIDLSGYTIDLSQKNTTTNTISYTASMKVTYIAGNPINGAQQISITTGLSGMQYSYADGYIGQYTVTIPLDTVSIGVFNNAYTGNVFFTNPVVQAYIYNSIGAPSDIKIDSLSAISYPSLQSSTTTNTQITGAGIINANIPIGFPTTSQQGQLIQTLIQLDRTNSNVQTVFNPAPNKIIFQMTGTINPAGNTGTLDFVTDSSKINIAGEVQVPMQGYVKQLVLLDTIRNMTYPSLAIPGNNNVSILKAGFNINLQNGFPMNARLQMYFLDSNGKVIDSLFSAGTQLIASGAIDNTGKVTTPTNTFFKEVFTEQRYNTITTQSSTAVLYAFFNTANNGTTSVSIYPSYQIKANIGIDVQANVSF